MKKGKKFTVLISSNFTVDTTIERKRIEEAFKSKPIVREKLNHLMDLIEAEKWEEANQEIEGEWWSGHDKESECPRLEFVGLLRTEGSVNQWASYGDLIYWMKNNPDMYTIATEPVTNPKGES